MKREFTAASPMKSGYFAHDAEFIIICFLFFVSSKGCKRFSFVHGLPFIPYEGQGQTKPDTCAYKSSREGRVMLRDYSYPV